MQAVTTSTAERAEPSTTESAETTGTTAGDVEVEDGEAVSEDSPTVDTGLRDFLVDVDGVSYPDAGDPGVGYYEALALPDEAPLARFDVEIDGAVVGSLTLVRPPDGLDAVEFEDDVVDRFFDDLVQFVSGGITLGSGQTAVATNGFPPQWIGLAGEFVMTSVNDVDDQARWQWFWDGFLWIVEGSGTTQTFVEDLIEAQHDVAPPDEFDTYIIAGELNDRFVDVPGYIYDDQSRDTLLGILPESIAQPCEAQWLLFGVTEGSGDFDPNLSEYVVVEEGLLGEYCPGFEEQLLTHLGEISGGTTQTIGGVEVVAGDTQIFWAEDGIVFGINLVDAGNWERFGPFIEAFLQHQADLPAPT